VDFWDEWGAGKAALMAGGGGSSAIAWVWGLCRR